MDVGYYVVGDLVPLSNCSVTVRSIATTDDGLGNTTETPTDTALEWALISPRASSERTDQRAPAVITAATIYGPFATPLDSDDLLIVTNHSPSMNGTWQVEGRPGDWSLGEWRPGFEVAVVRASAV